MNRGERETKNYGNKEIEIERMDRKGWGRR